MKRENSMNTPGYIYILSSNNDPNLIKIGQTTRDPFVRLKELNSTGLAYDLEMRGYYPVFDVYEAEKFLHTHYSQHRVRYDREFFSIDMMSLLSEIPYLLLQIGMLIPNNNDNEIEKHNDALKNSKARKTIGWILIIVGILYPFIVTSNSQANLTDTKSIFYISIIVLLFIISGLFIMFKKQRKKIIEKIKNKSIAFNKTKNEKIIHPNNHSHSQTENYLCTEQTVVNNLLISNKDLMDHDNFSPEDDDLIRDALTVIVDAGYASISLLQRRLSIGYPRAKRILNRLQELGYVIQNSNSKHEND